LRDLVKRFEEGYGEGIRQAKRKIKKNFAEENCVMT